ncbi:MAG: glycoside hydrolase family 27 protein [Lachnospiraceae bacterium]|nr:glycoside hydrolase family 27 protein [Lachnospiraceae bacterium]
MNKNQFAVTPPMGWNSYDYYDTTVTEADVKANADYMAAHLKQYGWEYIVVDIQWYAHDAGSQRDRHQYIPFWDVEMDEYSRLLPDPARFPSSAGGKGFGPLADYVHSLGLKFGIHIMRGIPRIAAHQHGKILGTDATANEIANPSSICGWNPDMYGVNRSREGAQQYYDSVFQQYADWGVDYVKCDDICNTNLYRENQYSAKEEVEMLHEAIMKTGRPIVLSLSPGPAIIDKAWHYEKYANMWRITDDFWDNWKLLLNMFERCELWQNHVSEGCFPDCDMLPLGWLGQGFHADKHTWYTNFTRDEQRTMMTLWCIFRSPLMLGTEMPRLDEWTLSLLTNADVLGLIHHSRGARQLARDKKHAVWFSHDTAEEADYLALFNLSDEETVIHADLSDEGISTVSARELWDGETAVFENSAAGATVAPHGAKLFKLKK